MSDIPDHLFVKILRRVPVESVFRFRSVCKGWRSIIDDPGFAKLHITKGLGERSLLIRSYTGKFFLLPMKTLINENCAFCDGEGCEDCCLKLVEPVNIKTPVGYLEPYNHPDPSCNGMMLMMSTCQDNWVIWNPFTGESLEVQVDNGLVYDRMGLGYDKANNVYKVVWANDDTTVIYSVNSRVWSAVNEDIKLLDNSYCDKANGVFANGALHWLYRTEDEGGELSETWFIVSLDLTTETYSCINVPKQLNEYSEHSQGGNISLELVAFNGCLFLTCRPTFLSFEAWKIDGGADKKIMSIFEKSSINLIAYLEGNDKVLSEYGMDDDFPWYYTLKNCLQKVSMEVNPDANRDDDCENVYDIRENLYETFSFQILSSSLARLQVSDHGAKAGVAPCIMKVK